MFVESDFLVTDFSSTSFEFAYMDKPTFMYVPDMNCVVKNIPQYHLENVEMYPHLIPCGTVKDVVSSIRKYHRDNINRFIISDRLFKYHDTGNTDRLL
jgi:CDP-glycerol glycerophosphotransferase (TagB/SpsB family)